MKKEYESPKAEKMTFDYSGVVVASAGSCIETSVYSYEAHGENENRCQTTYIGTEWTKSPV